MALTPGDVHNVSFKKPPMGRRGYDEGEVDAFLDTVEREVGKLHADNTALTAEVDRLRRLLDQAGSPAHRAVMAADGSPIPTPVGMSPEQANAQSVKILAMAQETADRFIADAQTQAEQLTGDARRQCDEMVTDARGQSEAMVQEAQSRAQGITEAAERRRQELMGGLEDQHTDLEREIEDLRGFEREYRTQLRSYFESRLRELDSRRQADRAAKNNGQPTGEQAAIGTVPPGR
jgi:DivIVA domain-containing protein